jgi:citrate lyase gamma subunit
MAKVNRDQTDKEFFNPLGYFYEKVRSTEDATGGQGAALTPSEKRAMELILKARTGAAIPEREILKARTGAALTPEEEKRAMELILKARTGAAIPEHEILKARTGAALTPEEEALNLNSVGMDDEKRAMELILKARTGAAIPEHEILRARAGAALTPEEYLRSRMTAAAVTSDDEKRAMELILKARTGAAVTPREHEQIVQDYVNQGSELPILSDEIDRAIEIWIQSQTGAAATPDEIQNLKDILLGRSVITEDYQELPPQGSISPYSTSDEGGIFSEDQMRSRWLGLTESPPTRGVLSDFAAKDRYQPRGSEMERERIEAEREKELHDEWYREYQRQRLLEEERRRQEELSPVPRQSPFIT